MKKIPIVFIAFIFSVANAEPVTYLCPQKIVTTSTANSTESDWESLGAENESHRNITAKLTQGHPKDGGELKPWNADMPASYYAKHKKVGTIYKFEGEAQGGYWLQCMYYNTSATYVKRLPDGLKVCELKSAKDPINCK